ncbi:transposase [bacterium AH-315-K20]|nr:transposase [bacterium AH-315-K20]
MPPLAYLLTWTTYGSWLRGDRRGSVINDNRWGAPYAPPDPTLVQQDTARLAQPPLVLGSAARAAVETAIRGVCRHREWTLHALNARSNHVHAVVTGAHTPEKMMVDLKAWSTRRLRDAGMVDGQRRVWTRHGSTRYLFDAASVERAVDYVVRMQDLMGERQSTDRRPEDAEPGAHA